MAEVFDPVKRAWATAREGKDVAILVAHLPAPPIEQVLQRLAAAEAATRQRRVVSVRRIQGACYNFDNGGKLELRKPTFRDRARRENLFFICECFEEMTDPGCLLHGIEANV